MTDRDEQRIQDYLDGRLAPAERAEFERRLRDDPGLARRLRALNEIGAALREGPAELSPSFYARARRSFEERSGRGAPAGLRVFSWEAAGLAAAAALAAALFVPHFLRDRTSPLPPPADPERARSGPAETGAAGAPSPAAGAGIGAEALGLSTSTEPEEREAGREELRKTAPATRDERSTEATEPRAPEAGRRVFAPAPAPATGLEDAPRPPAGRIETYAPVPAEADALRDAEGSAAPPAVPRPEPRAPRSILPPAGDSVADGVTAKLDDQRGETSVRREMLGQIGAEAGGAASALSPAGPPVPPIVPLPPGIVGPGSLRTIEEREAWEALVFGERPELLPLGPYDPRQRLVLIGGRLDCSSLRLVSTPEGWEIHAEDALRAPDSPSGGCALALPRDGRPVRVVASQ